MYRLIIFIALINSFQIYGENDPSSTIDFAQFVDLVSKNNPEKNIRDLSVERSIVAERRAGILEDPQFSITRDRVPISARKGMESSPSEEWQFSITQMFPWPGTLNEEKAASSSARKKVEQNIQSKNLETVLYAKEFYLNLIAASKALELEKENLIETTNIVKNAENRLQYGVGSHHDLIQAQNEQTILTLNIKSMEMDLENLKDTAAQMIGKEDAKGLTFKLSYDSIPFTLTASNVDLTESKLQATKDEASAQLNVERNKSLPNFMVSGMVMQGDDGMQSYSIMAGIKVPVFSGSTRSSVDDELAKVSLQASQELAWHERKKALATTQVSRRRIIAESNLQGLRGQIVPATEQHLKTLVSEYAEGKATFFTVNTARKQLLKYKLASTMAERDLAMVGISEERIKAGIVDSELGQAMPQIPMSEMNTAMDSGPAMGGMRSAPATKKPTQLKSNPSGAKQPEDDSDKQSKGNMGGNVKCDQSLQYIFWS